LNIERKRKDREYVQITGIASRGGASQRERKRLWILDFRFWMAEEEEDEENIERRTMNRRGRIERMFKQLA